MSIRNTLADMQNSYLRKNQIRTKLLLFIDNEIKSKIKQNTQNVKFNYTYESQFKISFEETFTQKQRNKYVFFTSIIRGNIKNNNSDKSSSTIDNSPNKITKKPYQKKRSSTHSKTLTKEKNRSNEMLNNSIYFKRKLYSIKKILRQSSTFLILPKPKNGAEYLKALCNNLKISKSHKKPVKHVRSNSITKCKLLDLNKDKKNEIITQKFKKENQYTHSLFKKSQKGNLVINGK